MSEERESLLSFRQMGRVFSCLVGRHDWFLDRYCRYCGKDKAA